MNILGINGDSLESGTLSYITCSEETSTVDGADGNGGGGGWHTGASNVDGCNVLDLDPL
jgi:hypothetical protein